MMKLQPPPPRPPLTRTIRGRVPVFCLKCGSTMSKTGFLKLFGKRLCDNKKCNNSNMKIRI